MHETHEADTKAAADTRPREMYVRLAIMLALSFLWMFAAMYAMVNAFDDVHINVNFVYMAALMAAAMGPIELMVMGRMYPDLRLKLVTSLVSVLVLLGSFLAIRAQTGVGDEQFLRSMIPHHSGAILMCEQASISDAEIRELCSNIIENQQSEIDQMEEILARLER